MGHRHMFNSSQILETENNEGRNHSEHAYVQFARAGASEGSNFVYPAQNTVIDGGNLALQLNHLPSSGGLLSGGLTSEYPQYQPQPQHQVQPPRPTYDPSLHTSSSGSNSMAQENYAYSCSSSIHGGQTFHGADGTVMDFPSGGRGPYKRKHHELPGVYQRGSSSRYWDTGSSSSVSMSADSQQEKRVADTRQPHSDYSSYYGGHGVPFQIEGTPRNVRSRTSFDLEGNSARTHFSPVPAHNSIASVPIDVSSMSNLWGQAPNMLTREQNHGIVNPAPHGRPLLSGIFGPESHIVMANSNHSATMEIGGYHGQYSFHQNPVPHNVQVNQSQTGRGIRSTFHQRSSPGIRASSSNLHPGNVVASDEGFPVVSHGPNLQLHDRSGRPRMSVDCVVDRYQALHGDLVVRNHLTPEGRRILDRSSVYLSRTIFDQHRDMRLDIDDMTYEELLALEERIGNVNTGVCEDQISNCLTESIVCSSDQPQEEGKCVICLEEYKNMDEVGTLKLCGHGFHVRCIRKWLAVKNVCPICKSCALDDKMKDAI